MHKHEDLTSRAAKRTSKWWRALLLESDLNLVTDEFLTIFAKLSSSKYDTLIILALEKDNAITYDTINERVTGAKDGIKKPNLHRIMERMISMGLVRKSTPEMPAGRGGSGRLTAVFSLTDIGVYARDHLPMSEVHIKDHLFNPKAVKAIVCKDCKEKVKVLVKSIEAIEEGDDEDEYEE